MKYKDYEQFVINYKPFEWEVRDYDFRDTMKSKHSFLMSFIRVYKVNNYLDILFNEKNNVIVCSRSVLCGCCYIARCV